MKKDDFAGLIAGLESQGFNRSEIARAAGISRKTVWRIASGQAREPDFNTIQRLRRFEEKNLGGVAPLSHKIR
jgi:transcriptional regulator with XRE-family HTH domain